MTGDLQPPVAAPVVAWCAKSPDGRLWPPSARNNEGYAWEYLSDEYCYDSPGEAQEWHDYDPEC